MNNVKCPVCRVQFSSMRSLKTHCFSSHSKNQLIRTLVKNALFNTSAKKARQKPRDVKFCGVSPKYLKSEILYLEDGFENSFLGDQNFNEPKIKVEYDGERYDSNNLLVDENNNFTENGENDCSSSTDSSSIDDKSKLKYVIGQVRAIERRRKRKLDLLKEFRFQRDYENYRCNKSLNEKTGEFYVCHCSELQRNNKIIEVYQKEDLEVLKSDTESCSDSGFFFPLVDHKVYCNTCGNSYRTKQKLIEHLKIHQTRCKICDKIFSIPQVYKQHMRSHLLKTYVCHLCKEEFAHKSMLLEHLDAHIEDEVYENVFGLEQDYEVDDKLICQPCFGPFMCLQ